MFNEIFLIQTWRQIWKFAFLSSFYPDCTCTQNHCKFSRSSDIFNTGHNILFIFHFESCSLFTSLQFKLYVLSCLILVNDYCKISFWVDLLFTQLRYFNTSSLHCGHFEFKFISLYFKLNNMCCHSEVMVDTGEWLPDLWITLFVEVLKLLIALIFVQEFKFTANFRFVREFTVLFFYLDFPCCMWCVAKLSLGEFLHSWTSLSCSVWSWALDSRDFYFQIYCFSIRVVASGLLL